jgi:hypothetical protein
MVQPALGADLPLQPLATAEARTGPPRRSRRWRIAAPSFPHREGAKPDKRPHWPFFVPARGASRTPRRAHQPALMTAGISGSWGGAVLLPSPPTSRETGLILAGATISTASLPPLEEPLLQRASEATEATLAEQAEEGSDGRAAGGSEAAQQCSHFCTVRQTLVALISLQLGWGLWLLPCDFARLGWVAGPGR